MITKLSCSYSCQCPDNINEMMLQFEGREEALIETIRTMQECSVAQRTHAAARRLTNLRLRQRLLFGPLGVVEDTSELTQAGH